MISYWNSLALLFFCSRYNVLLDHLEENLRVDLLDYSIIPNSLLVALLLDGVPFETGFKRSEKSSSVSIQLSEQANKEEEESFIRVGKPNENCVLKDEYASVGLGNNPDYKGKIQKL